jgi:hypothetical protein
VKESQDRNCVSLNLSLNSCPVEQKEVKFIHLHGVHTPLLSGGTGYTHTHTECHTHLQNAYAHTHLIYICHSMALHT